MAIEFSKDDYALMERILEYADPRPPMVSDLVARKPAYELRRQADLIEKRAADIAAFRTLCHRIRAWL